MTKCDNTHVKTKSESYAKTIGKQPRQYRKNLKSYISETDYRVKEDNQLK